MDGFLKLLMQRSQGASRRRRQALGRYFRPEAAIEVLERRVLLATVSVGANVNISQRTGSQAEAAIAVDPTNPLRLAAFSNEEAAVPGVFAAYSTNGGATWTGRDIGDGHDGLLPACCDTQAVFDRFGNLFVTYAGFTAGLTVLQSIDGGKTFSTLTSIDLTDPDVDQPSIAVGLNSVWISFTNGSDQVVASGATVTGLGQVSAFSPLQTVPGASGNFGDVVVGPLGQVTVIYQAPGAPIGPGTIFVAVDQDGLGAGGFTSPILFSTTNVGTADTSVPGNSNNQGIDAEANLAWDLGSGRLYAVYTDAAAVGSPNTDIFVRTSTTSGVTWSAPVKVNDDATTGSQFLPSIAVDSSTGNIAVAWYDTRNDQTGGTPNHNAQLFATFSIDGGTSFLPNVQVSTGTSNSAASGFSNEKGYGDFILDKGAFFQGVFHPIWADNSNSTGNNPQGALSGLDLYTAAVTLTVTDTNSAPTDISLSGTSVQENQPPGTAVGTFSTADPNAGNTFTYSLVTGSGATDNSSFAISGNVLQTAAVFNLATKASFNIRVRTTDQGGLFFEKAFTIVVTAAPATTESFVISAGDGQVYGQRLNGDGTPIGSPFLAAPGQVKSLVAGKFGAGNDLLFVQGFDNQVYELTFTGSTPSPGGYVLTQAGAVKSMALAAYGASTPSPALFVIGGDNQVYFKLFDAAGAAAGGYTLVPGAVNSIALSAPAAAPFAPTLFAIGLDNQVYAQRFTAAGALSGTYFLTQAGGVQSIVAARDAGGNPFLLAIGLDSQVYSQKFNASGASLGYALVQAGGVQFIQAGNDPTTNRPELFAIGLDNQLYAIPFDNAANPASAYTLTSPGGIKSVVTGHTASGIVFVLAIGLDNQVYGQEFNSAGVSTTPYFLAIPGAAATVAIAG